MIQQSVGKTSLKGMFQDIAAFGSTDVVLGVVKSTDPLSVQVLNDEKLLLNESILYVPEHLKDYETEVTLHEWKTEDRAGGGGEAAFASHNHDITGRKKVTIHNALKTGDQVHLLSFAKGKQYFVLGRV